MIDDAGRLVLDLGSITSLMSGYPPPREYSCVWVEYFLEMCARVDEEFGPEHWIDVQLLAGNTVAPEFDRFYAWNAAFSQPETRADALAQIRSADPSNYKAWLSTIEALEGQL